jgi:integrase
MKNLFERYASEHLPRKAPRAAADDRSMWERIILPFFGHRKVGDVTHADCDQLHWEIARKHPVRANRVTEVLRKAMNLAVRWGWRTDNPAVGVHRSPEERRERYLDVEEIGRVRDALEKHKERASATAIHLMLLTGCRKGEALAAHWSELDLAAATWTKPSAHTKQRKLHRAELSGAAVALLSEWRTECQGEFVFPGRAGQPLTDVKRTWEAVRRDAGVSDVRLHDLRHTYASFMASAGHSLLTIGKVLGHTQAQTTARYAHLFDDPLREAAEGVAAAMRIATK